jgi:hypothetical protein
MSHTIKALAILVLIFSDYSAWASKILVKEYGNYVFQYDQTTNQIINDRSKFNISYPYHLQLDSKGFEKNYLQVKFKKGSTIFVDNKLYKESLENKVELIPINNLKLFSGKVEFLVSFYNCWMNDFSDNLKLVGYSKPKYNKPTNKNYVDIAQKIPKKIYSAHYFNQFAFISLLLVTVFFSQSLFAKRTVFVGASAIRQSRFRSMDDNLKLFGFNVLIFSFLFSGFSFNKIGADGFILSIFTKNLFFVTLFFSVKIFLNGASKKIFFDTNALSFYANNYLHITALFGIFLASLFYLEAFSFFSFPSIPLELYLGLFMLAELAYVVSFAFMNYELSRYKLFYIISYICAFEGIPLLILAKYLFQTGIISS